jgi:hypothetical protein
VWGIHHNVAHKYDTEKTHIDDGPSISKKWYHPHLTFYHRKKKVRRDSSKPNKNLTLIVVDAHFHVPHMHEKNRTFMMSFIEYCSLEHRVEAHLNP